MRVTRLRVFLVASLLALSLPVSLEVALRLRGWHERAPDYRFQTLHPEAARAGYLRADSELAYGLAPHYRSSREHASTYATGSWPYRGRPPEPAPPETVRVLVLGDSCVYGVGVNVADTLAAQIERKLHRRGMPASLQVLNLGVPGYSTEQMDGLLARSLDELAPNFVILYPAAWNDQAAAMKAPDRELLAQSPRADGPRLALQNWFAHVRPPSLDEFQAVQAAWREGSPRFGTRVPAEEVGPNVERMLKRCAERDVEALVLLPTHPKTTREANPRVAADLAAVARASSEAGVETVDLGTALRAAAVDDARAFVDFVHPSPVAQSILAEHAAAWLAARITPASEVDDPTRVVAVRPDRVPSLGDTRIEVEINRAFATDAPPVILIGGAPLLDVEVTGRSTAAGTVTSNAPGRHDVIVQSPRFAARAEDAVLLEAPRFERDGSRLTFISRPGDRAVVVVASGLWTTPRHDPKGLAFLDPSRVEASYGPLVCGANGTVVVPVDLDDAEGANLWFQAFVTPRGERDQTREARYSELFHAP